MGPVSSVLLVALLAYLASLFLLVLLGGSLKGPLPIGMMGSVWLLFFKPAGHIILSIFGVGWLILGSPFSLLSKSRIKEYIRYMASGAFALLLWLLAVFNLITGIFYDWSDAPPDCVKANGWSLSCYF